MQYIPSVRDITTLYSMDTAAMATLRRPEVSKKKKDSLLETSVPYAKWPYKAALRVNVDRTMIYECGLNEPTTSGLCKVHTG